MAFKFGDFVKAQWGVVLRVVYVPDKETDKFGSISKQGNLSWITGEATLLPDYVDFDGPAKPEPVYVPWTFETMPVGVKVRSKKVCDQKRVAFPRTSRCVNWGGYEFSYEVLLNDYEQLDGSPCGQLKEVK